MIGKRFELSDFLMLLAEGAIVFAGVRWLKWLISINELGSDKVLWILGLLALSLCGIWIIVEKLTKLYQNIYIHLINSVVCFLMAAVIWVVSLFMFINLQGFWWAVLAVFCAVTCGPVFLFMGKTNMSRYILSRQLKPKNNQVVSSAE